MAVSVLIVEDDRNIAELLQMYLEKEGYAVTTAGDGGKGLEKFRTIKPDLVLLDLGLPDMDGEEFIRAARRSSAIPIIVLSARTEEHDKVSALDLGANDYITKPFETKEVIARIKAVLRRTNDSEKHNGVNEVKYDKLRINLTNYELEVNGARIDTPPKELELIYHLASNPNRVYTRDQLLDEVWGFDYYGDSRTVDVHVKRLREKLENVSDEWSLKTVWGVGYKFEVVQQ